MKLILASSIDGYLARSDRDNMSWTGPDDKTVFKLLTAVGGGHCAAGTTTWKGLPTLPGRTVRPISRRPRLVQHQNGDTAVAGSLEAFHADYPAGWLLGGPTVAMAALEAGLIDEVFMCHVPVLLRERGEPFNQGLHDSVTPWLMSRGETTNMGIPWRVTQCNQVGNVRVDTWRKHGQ